MKKLINFPSPFHLLSQSIIRKFCFGNLLTRALALSLSQLGFNSLYRKYKASPKLKYRLMTFHVAFSFFVSAWSIISERYINFPVFGEASDAFDSPKISPELELTALR
ncbi:unnamed protein product [Rhizophagus irregularis]|nr:unnamed protein product [Rhizophagus irregularis]CAB5387070.1 unnamed protein product [Rhizophagus irregularis]